MGILLLVCLVGALIVAEAVMLGRLWPRIEMPSCAKCRYAVRGLPTFTCPECGSDLREVGIVTRQPRVAPSRAAVALLWTAVVVVLAMFALHVSDAIGLNSRPGFVAREVRMTIEEPRSKAYTSIHVYALTPMVREGQVIPAPTVRATLRRFDGWSEPLVVDADGLIVTPMMGGDTRGGARLTADAIGQWMALAGIDTTDTAVENEIEHLLTEISVLQAGGYGGYGRGEFGIVEYSGLELVAWTATAVLDLALCVLLPIIIWVAGLVVLLRRIGRPRPVVEVHTT